MSEEELSSIFGEDEEEVDQQQIKQAKQEEVNQDDSSEDFEEDMAEQKKQKSQYAYNPINNQKQEPQEYNDSDEDDQDGINNDHIIKHKIQEDNEEEKDGLSELSDMDYGNEQKVGKIEQRDDLGNLSYDDEDDDYPQDQQISNQKRKKNRKDKEGGKKKRQKDDGQSYEQVKVTEKDKQQEKQQLRADALSKALIREMEIAQDRDSISLKNRRPAIQRLLVLNKLFKLLNNQIIKDTFVEDRGLEQLYNWLLKLPQSDITMRKKILQLLFKLNITPDVIDTEDIVIHCLDTKQKIQAKSSKITFDKEIRKLYIDLVDSWGPALAGKREDL